MKKRIRLAAGLLAMAMTAGTCTVPAGAAQVLQEESAWEGAEGDAAGTTGEEAPASDETVKVPALIIAPAAEGIESGVWQEDIETIHHDEEGHYETRKTGEREVVDKEVYDERVKHWFYECTVCLFRSEDVVEINDHLAEHPTGNGNHYYTIIGGQEVEIYPSYRDKYEIITVHHDAETHMEDVYGDVWVVDTAAYDEEVHTGVFRYYVDGKPVTGILAAIDGETYLFDADGAPMTGWRKVGDDLYYFGAGGKMQTGWRTRDEKELYLDPETGKAAFDTVLTVDGTPYYFNSEGTAFKEGVVENNGREYYFDGEELAKEKWVKTDAGMSYFDADGVKATGVVNDGGKVYPVGEDGTLKACCWVTAGGRRYYTDETGAAVTGWHKIGGRKYYFADERYKTFKESDRGRMMSGWASVGNRTYYFVDSRYSDYLENKTGILLSGWKTIAGRKYYFMDAFYADYNEKSKGILLTGFRKINGKTRYLTDERAAGYKDWKRGIMLAGHATIGGKGYFFSPTGVMATNQFATKDGEKYYFSKNGVMVKQIWVTVNGRKFYLDKSGKMHKGFLTLGNKTYYFGWNGVLAVNRLVKYDGRWRWADENGVLR